MAAACCWALCATAQDEADTAAASAADAAYDACMQIATSTLAMSDCTTTGLQAHDARLNRNYTALRASLPPERKAALLQAQRDWLKFRDSQCAFVRSAGGTQAAVSAGDCRRRVTAARATELHRALPAR